MAGSYSQPIKANEVYFVWNSRFSTFNQNSSNKEMTTYDLHSCSACELPIFSSWRTELKIFNRFNQKSSNKERTTYNLPLHGIQNLRFSTFNQNSSNKETTTTRQSRLVFTVHAKCLQTVNFLFV